MPTPRTVTEPLVCIGFSCIRLLLHQIQLQCALMRITFNPHTYVIEEFGSVRFDSVCPCSNGALHNTVKFCTVMYHVMYYVISSSAVWKELIQKEAY